MRRFGLFVVAMLVWGFSCRLADYVFKIEANSWAMMWGYVVGRVVAEIIDISDRHAQNQT